MIGLGWTSFASGNPFRSLGPKEGQTAELLLSGEAAEGAAGETRTVLGMAVSNGGPVPVWVQVESEATGQQFAATVQPGQTVTIPGGIVEAYWNPDARPQPRWDGVNVRWKEPA